MEGFVAFLAGTTIQTQTSDPYNIMSTVYRVDSTLSEIRIEITGGQSTWEPWVSSGIGIPIFQSETWIFQMQFPVDGKVEVGLSVPAPSVTDHISVTAVAGGITEVRRADIAPVSQTPTTTPTNSSTSVPPTATSTDVPPTTTPTVTPEPLIVLEGGVNTQEGFRPFSVTNPVTVTTAYPADIVATVYNRGDATGARITITAHRLWTATVSGGSGELDYQGPISSDWGQWVYEGAFSGTGPIEFVVHTTTPPFRPTLVQWDIAVKAVPLGTGDWQERHATIQSPFWGLYLPFMLR